MGSGGPSEPVNHAPEQLLRLDELAALHAPGEDLCVAHAGGQHHRDPKDLPALGALLLGDRAVKRSEER